MATQRLWDLAPERLCMSCPGMSVTRLNKLFQFVQHLFDA